MLRKIAGMTAIACVVAAAALAQEPTRVEPTHYRLDFENEHVQVISVHYGPHEKSGLHAHPGGVVVSLTEAHLRFTDQNGKIQEVYSKAGEARWFPPFKHRVENLGDTAYNAVYIGMKNKNLESAYGTTDEEQRDEIERIVAEAFSRARN